MIMDEIKYLRNHYDLERWQAFKTAIERDVREVCKNNSTRQLVSVCDTYVDFAPPLEAGCAMCIVTFANMEKFAFSVRKTAEIKEGTLWDGMTAFRPFGDAVRNLTFRIRRCASSFPHLRTIFDTIFLRMLDCPHTSLAILNDCEEFKKINRNKADFRDQLVSRTIPSAMRNWYQSKEKIDESVHRQ